MFKFVSISQLSTYSQIPKYTHNIEKKQCPEEKIKKWRKPIKRNLGPQNHQHQDQVLRTQTILKVMTITRFHRELHHLQRARIAIQLFIKECIKPTK